MHQISFEKTEIALSLSPADLRLLCNALNESLETIEDWEFHSRMGDTKLRVRQVMDQLQQILADSQ